MKQFTFYKLYADILDAMNDTDAGKFAMRICEYEFEDKLPEAELSGKERFYWSNIADMLAEVKEAESSGGKAKSGAGKTQESAEKESGEQQITREDMAYEQFRSAQNDKQNNRGGGMI